MSLAEAPSRASTQLRPESFSGTTRPSELVDLRTRVLVDELHLRDSETLFDASDELGEHLLIYRDDALVAAATLAPAEATDFPSLTGLGRGRLPQTSLLTSVVVDPASRGRDLLALTAFLAMRRQRMAGCTHFVAFDEPGARELHRLLGSAPIQGVPRAEMRGTDVTVHPRTAVFGRIDEAMLRCFEAMDEPHRDVARGDGSPLLVVAQPGRGHLLPARAAATPAGRPHLSGRAGAGHREVHRGAQRRPAALQVDPDRRRDPAPRGAVLWGRPRPPGAKLGN